MKLEKREIALNETDSLQDAFFVEKTLLYEYVNALEKISRKETRKDLLEKLKATGEDVFFVCDLIRRTMEQNGIKTDGEV